MTTGFKVRMSSHLQYILAICVYSSQIEIDVKVTFVISIFI